MESTNIILIKDLLESKEAKEKELKFYTEKLKELQFKLNFIQSDINLTNKIIDIIEKETVIEVKPYE